MPAWLASAVRLLFGTPFRAATTGVAAGQLAQAGGLGFGSLADFIPGGVDPITGKKRRRRRRRSLTASDRADIGFITGLLGTAAGKSFALTIASKTL